MTIIIILILLFLILRTIFQVMWYGKSIIKPDFERVDLQFSRRKNISTNWDSPLGHSVYYTFLIIFLLVISLIFFD